MSRRRRSLLVVLGILVLVPAVVLVFRPSRMMPLDEKAFARFQQANSESTRTLLEQHPDMSSPVRSALAFRMAVKATGFHPGKSVLYWISDEFRRDIAAGDPAEAVMKTRRAGSLVSIALGDGANEDEFEEILEHVSPELREAAKRRRGKR